MSPAAWGDQRDHKHIGTRHLVGGTQFEYRRKWIKRTKSWEYLGPGDRGQVGQGDQPLESRPYYVPTQDDRAILQQMYGVPGENPVPWEKVRGDLLASGCTVTAITELDAPTIMRVLAGEISDDKLQDAAPDPVLRGPSRASEQDHRHDAAGETNAVTSEVLDWRDIQSMPKSKLQEALCTVV